MLGPRKFWSLLVKPCCLVGYCNTEPHPILTPCNSLFMRISQPSWVVSFGVPRWLGGSAAVAFVECVACVEWVGGESQRLVFVSHRIQLSHDSHDSSRCVFHLSRGTDIEVSLIVFISGAGCHWCFGEGHHLVALWEDLGVMVVISTC